MLALLRVRTYPDVSVVSGYVRNPARPGRTVPVMSEFSAVVTTGIYCRPGCGARPRARNVRTYGLAAAAEAAGFRACLRCRPYRTDHSVGWGGSELVCRGVRLICDGALDGGTEAELATLLHTSGRHLRRLFVDEVGVTPDRLARSRRTHFARRLLDDTDLSVTEVAFASGFGSVRQLNRACNELFHASPRELRARRRVSDRLVADGGLTLRLGFDGALDLDPMLAYLSARAIEGVEHVSGRTYRRTVLIDGDPGALEISRGGPDHLLLRAHLPHWEGLIHIVQRARHIFALDADVDGATHGLVADPLVGPLVRRRPGLRLPGSWDPYETGVRAIIGQQVSVAGANTLAARLVARHGTPVPGLAQLGLTHLFPAPQVLADADLDGLGLTTSRAEAIRGFARAVADGALRLDRSTSLDELVASITAVAGLGPWTAHYLAARMGEPDAFPATDLGLRRAVAQVARDGAATDPLPVEAERWRPWRAHAAAHLWLHPDPLTGKSAAAVFAGGATGCRDAPGRARSTRTAP